MKIGIFGGSFNPIHKGHIEIANEAIKTLNLDQLIFVPAYKNPNKINHNYALEHHRIKMIEFVLPPKCSISKVEINAKKVSYTIETINYFLKKFPEAQLFFILGSDNLDHIQTWEGIYRISQKVRIVCFRRENKFPIKNIKKFNIQMLNNKLYPFSSTNYRFGEIKNVPDKVQEYIGKNFLYINELVKNHYNLEQQKEIESFLKIARRIGAENDCKLKWIELIVKLSYLTINQSEKWQKSILQKNRNTLPFPLSKEEQIINSSLLWLMNQYKITNPTFLAYFFKLIQQKPLLESKYHQIILATAIIHSTTDHQAQEKYLQEAFTNLSSFLKKRMNQPRNFLKQRIYSSLDKKE